MMTGRERKGKREGGV
uniref:Uncharacterized protein n=1 Tax=Anguilla anguilla TaxID=7936 RepID=A0A0E9SWL1_ANGAN